MTTRIDNGEWLKEERLKLLRKRRAVYVRRGQRALLKRLLHTGLATIDDVRNAVKLPPGIDPKLFGAVPGPLIRDGIIAAHGFVRTARPEGHARPVTVWRLTSSTKAAQWLSDHPDVSDMANERQTLLFASHDESDFPATAAHGSEVP